MQECWKKTVGGCFIICSKDIFLPDLPQQGLYILNGLPYIFRLIAVCLGSDTAKGHISVLVR